MNERSVDLVKAYELINVCPDNFCSLTHPNGTNKLLYIDKSPNFYFKINKVLFRNWKEIFKKYIVR